MIILGLTGSIGMGKSTAGAMLRHLGIPLHEADEEVHTLLGPDGKAVPAVCTEFPLYEFPMIYGKKDKTGRRPLKRKELGALIFSDDEKREALEAILHPFIREAQNIFIRTQSVSGQKIIALDIPLLFETGGENLVDYIITMSAPAFIQKERVLSRTGMNNEKFKKILDRQMSDGEKCLRSNFIIHTGLGRAHMMKELKSVLQQIIEKHKIKKIAAYE